MRMLDAHITLLRAELEVTGREIGIIAGLALGAFVIVVLASILLYVGSFLFFGELLFGSMGWGIIHGTLLAAAVVGFVAINLAGGHVDRYGWGAIIGLVVTVVVAALLLSNVGNGGGETLRDWLNDNLVTEDLPFGDAWLVTLSGLVLGGLVALVVALIAGWRSNLRGRELGAAGFAGFVIGAIIGAIWFSTRYAAPDGVLGLAITIGLLSWIVAGIVLAARAGFDPEARYANLIPRESLAAFETTKEFLSEQWQRQKNRMMGR
jgi:MFS family permease